MISSTPDTAAIPMPTPTSAPAATTPAMLPASTDAVATIAPSAIATRPMAAMTPYPRFDAHPGLSNEKTSEVTAVGTKYRPAASAPWCCGPWIHWVSTNCVPMTPKKSAVMVAAPQRNRGSRRVSSSMSGWGERSSRRANATNSSTPATAAPRTSGDPHPCWGPSTMATITAVRAPHQSSALHRSTGGDAGSCERGTHFAASTRVTSTTGTFTRNTEPHQKCASSTPPTTGPIAVAVPPTPDQIAIARPRSCAGKMFPSTDRVEGIVHAPPTPMTPRATASAVAVVANAAATDAAPKITSPNINRPLRPRRSPTTASGSSRPASTNPYELPIHWSPVSSVCSPRWMLGNATARIVLSITITDRARQSTLRARHRRG